MYRNDGMGARRKFFRWEKPFHLPSSPFTDSFTCIILAVFHFHATVLTCEAKLYLMEGYQTSAWQLVRTKRIFPNKIR